MSIRDLDLRGLKCPLPALKTAAALRLLSPGERLSVACTDPLAAIDIPNLIRERGDVLERQETRDGAVTFLIRRGSGSGAPDQTRR